uniref:Integrase catalytic domain-containing protein n=1 Tax=Sinocyclocheilus rhinocerous TaxID=307959 RepID=A0A673MV46_9TELE
MLPIFLSYENIHVSAFFFFLTSNSDVYSTISNEELDALVQEIHCVHPNVGNKMMMGHLNSRGIRIQRHRVRESMRRVDMEGTLTRRMAIRTSHRCQYSVAAPNSLWHIDGNHKLIRFVVHGGIDGFSRLIVYLLAATNNRASTVFNSFLSAIMQYGTPSRVRSDKGGKNIQVAHYMVHQQGENRNSHITGKSVHNQRIERLWRDVYENVLDLFYTVFTRLEYEGLLDPDNEIHPFSLHRCYLHHIQHHLKMFQDAWNHHGLRTAGSRSPFQLWLLNEREGPHNHHAEGLSIPEVELSRPLTEQDIASLPNPTVPFSEAIATYCETVDILTGMLEQSA